MLLDIFIDVFAVIGRMTFPRTPFQCSESKDLRPHAQRHTAERVGVIIVLGQMLLDQSLQLFHIGERIISRQSHYMRKAVLADALVISFQHIGFAATVHRYASGLAMPCDGIVLRQIAGGDHHLYGVCQQRQPAQHMIQQNLSRNRLQCFSRQAGRPILAV
jgi:hypothetical protein